MNELMLNGVVIDWTGYSPGDKMFINKSTAIVNALTLLAMSTIGAKIANRSGANRLLKKASGGYLKVC